MKHKKKEEKKVNNYEKEFFIHETKKVSILLLTPCNNIELNPF
jgi:hypothetical protein